VTAWEIKTDDRDSVAEHPIALTHSRGNHGTTIHLSLDNLRELSGLLGRYDLISSAASQHYIETGELTKRTEPAAISEAEAALAALDADEARWSETFDEHGDMTTDEYEERDDTRATHVDSLALALRNLIEEVRS
jgi:hypothetical protein